MLNLSFNSSNQNKIEHQMISQVNKTTKKNNYYLFNRKKFFKSKKKKVFFTIFLLMMSYNICCFSKLLNGSNSSLLFFLNSSLKTLVLRDCFKPMCSAQNVYVLGVASMNRNRRRSFLDMQELKQPLRPGVPQLITNT